MAAALACLLHGAVQPPTTHPLTHPATHPPTPQAMR